MKRMQILHCDEGITPELRNSSESRYNSNSIDISGTVRPGLSYLSDRSKSFFMAACWGLLLSVWLCALVGPLLVIYAVYTHSWNLFINVVCVWMLSAIVQFPYLAKFSDLVSQGLELWFDAFSIDYEHNNLLLSLEPQEPTIYCYHPHGVFSIGMVLLAADLVRRGEPVAIVTSSHMRWFNPVLKLLLDLAGIEIVGSSPAQVQAAMKEGKKSLILVPGGYEEGVLTREGFERVFLKSRMGFVKYAMRHGYSLTPVYAYGENDLFTCIPFADSVRKFLASWKLPVVIFYGHPQLPFMPKQNGIHITVGSPLIVPKIAEPSIETLHTTHAVYIESLMELYYRNNQDVSRPLEIF